MASCVRFLQCAGFLFDSPVWDGPAEWTSIRNQDLWQTFQTVLSLCRTERIDVLFITGDLFEQDYVRRETVERVAQSLGQLEGIRIFITPGKRDPLVMTSAYRLTAWPGNVHIFSSGVKSVGIPDLNATVSGAAWTAYHQATPFLDDFRAPDDGALQLLLLHAEADTEKNIAFSGLDYLALGHGDTWSGIQKSGETYWADCGAVEARSFHHGGSHGVIIGEVNKDSSQFEFRELGQRSYIEIDLAVQPEDTMEGILEKLLAETSPEGRQKDLFRVNLTGTLLNLQENAQFLQKRLKTEFRFLEVLTLDEKTHSLLRSPGVTAKKDLGYPTQAQIFMDKLQERLVNADDSESKKYWEFVQKIGLTALEQGRVFDED
ncbi:metallophosphoesterase family protein [Desulfosporosinus youngiae]|uniref:DNA repair exonuclease n=1 Tax=Desulfosporosinus youngiae DSM 17734 TaxID=768710 RepID=H5XUT7_9FIRM|nr:hypothetical protein [Desulfosporosinus youngiae]EHQ89244.1 hypothetical protein DesyoDRAFT_2159 [Desulfosporosinus youngiae DSM 17734]